jgi:hypothetical protein
VPQLITDTGCVYEYEARRKAGFVFQLKLFVPISPAIIGGRHCVEIQV